MEIEIGNRFGKITVIRRDGSKNGKKAWFCECDCGVQKTIRGDSLKKGDTKSCGLCMRGEDLVGNKYGRLTVIEMSGVKNKKIYWDCVCDCGTIKNVQGQHLKSGKIVSCGCYKKERAIEANSKHKKRYSRLYNIYMTMKQRCLNENNNKYIYYGGRGISICDEWLDKENGFMNFYEWSMSNGYNEHLTIDRINNNGNYEPSNCRWTTMKEQNLNKRNNKSKIEC